MPLYSYECPNCADKVDDICSVEHRDMKQCEKCLEKKERVHMNRIINFQGRINGNCASKNS
jgi:putative FmdB family regulatory protein